MKKTARGFTLVELLIVIVVISILAAISIVAYNGMNNRAYTTRMATSVSSYDKALNLIAAEYGAYTKDPSIISGATTCLGKASNYPATSRFPAGVCVVNSSNSANNVAFNSTITNQLQEVLSDMPDVPAEHEVRYGTTSRYYRGASVFVSDNWFQIEIGLPSSVSCPSNMKEYDAGGIHWCEFEGTIPS